MQQKIKVSTIKILYERFVKSKMFQEVYKDKSVGEQMKIEE